MTPLAQIIVKELTRPPADRRMPDHGGVLPLMSDVHCFECSDLWEVLTSLSGQIMSKGVWPDESRFLPAPKTWVEHRTLGDGECARMGYLVIQDTNKPDRVTVRIAGLNTELGPATEHGFMRIDGFNTDRPEVTLVLTEPRLNEHWKSAVLFLRMVFSIINAPHFIGRLHQQPHRGLAKSLKYVEGDDGKPFCLRPWTQILLEATPPKDMSDVEGYAPRLTGKKALHFCRAHLRIVSGRAVFVRSHFRGDASVGVVQADYKVLPPKGDLGSA